jgi:hypothetical protein
VTAPDRGADPDRIARTAPHGGRLDRLPDAAGLPA